jgi:Rrf2 family protein
MKLTCACSYALDALVFMARQQTINQPIRSKTIADKRGLPPRFLLKVLTPLVDANLLRSVKGPQGGYLLARDPADISLLDIVEAAEGPIQQIAPVGKANRTIPNEQVAEIFKTSAQSIRSALSQIRLSQMLADTKDLQELDQVPQVTPQSQPSIPPLSTDAESPDHADEIEEEVVEAKPDKPTRRKVKSNV